MSLKTITWSSSKTFLLGISPRTIRQKMQFSLIDPPDRTSNDTAEIYSRGGPQPNGPPPSPQLLSRKRERGHLLDSPAQCERRYLLHSPAQCERRYLLHSPAQCERRYLLHSPAQWEKGYLLPSP